MTQWNEKPRGDGGGHCRSGAGHRNPGLANKIMFTVDVLCKRKAIYWIPCFLLHQGFVGQASHGMTKERTWDRGAFHYLWDDGG